MPRAAPVSPPARKSPIIVAIGASAGGLKAIGELLSALTPSTGLSFVVLQHLPPDHTSMLPELLGRQTRMAVREAREGIVPLADTVYVIPPGKALRFERNRIHLSTPVPGTHNVIDEFMTSLAAARKNRAIGVILSGSGSDGTIGLEAIKSAGGLTFAQSEASAEHEPMPRSAIAAGCADFVLAPAEIARRLTKIARHPYVENGDAVATLTTSDTSLDSILDIVRQDTGVDFSQYKVNTIKRRVERRMALQAMDDPAAYVNYLAENPGEVKRLSEDFLISATRFFRDPATWKALRRWVLEDLLPRHSQGESIRVWSLGCSTGEETYTAAMVLLDAIADSGRRFSVQIFGTDLSESAIVRARAGRYPKEIAADVGEGRLQRFFTREEHGYRVGKAVRDVCIFARHNLLRDSPFSHLDLLLCRNVLIYMDSELQARVLPILRSALNPGGALVLGPSESLGPVGTSITMIDREHKIYVKSLDAPATAAATPIVHPFMGLPELAPNTAISAPYPLAEAQQEADRLVLRDYGRPGVIVDARLNILQFRGVTRPYLDPGSGAASLNLLKMTRGDLTTALRPAIAAARRTGARVHREGLRLSEDDSRLATIDVYPLRAKSKEASLFLVLFDQVASLPPGKARGRAELRESTRLRKALQESTASLHSLMEEHDAAREEFQAASAEIASANEELQSTNEQLETSKEELQSANEELFTVNDELRHRNIELHQANNDLSSLISTIPLPLIMVDRELRIRRFSPSAEQALRVIAADVGRRITDLRTNLGALDLEQVIAGVIATGTPRVVETRANDGHWYSLAVHPYRSTEQRVVGAVLFLIDIDQVKREAELAGNARDVADAILNNLRHPLVALDEDLHIVRTNEAFCLFATAEPKSVQGSTLGRVCGPAWDTPEVRGLILQALRDDKSFEAFPIDYEVDGERRFVMLSGGRLHDGPSKNSWVLLEIDDVTERNSSSRILIAGERAAGFGRLTNVVSKEITGPLQSIASALFLLEQQALNAGGAN